MELGKIEIYKRGIKAKNFSIIPKMPYSDRAYVRAFQASMKIKLPLYYEHKERQTFTRGEIKKFSNKSKKRLSWVYMQYDWSSMLTFTYHKSFPVDYNECKEHLHKVLQLLKKMGIGYLWVLEFQGRGFPHYHVWLSREVNDLERQRIVLTWLKATCKYNDTNESRKFSLHRSMYTPWKVDLKVNYAVKYAEKQEQKMLPVGHEKFGRWWGVARCIKGQIQPEESYEYDNEDSEQYKQMISCKRQIKRYIANVRRYRLKRNGKKRHRDSYSGFTYIFTKNRMDDIKKIFRYYVNEVINRVPGWVENDINDINGFS